MKIDVRKLRKAVTVIAIAVILMTGVGLMPKASAAEVTSAAGIVTTTSGSLNVRNEARSSGTVIAKLPAGTYITLISKTGSWWYVEYIHNGYGYVSADYTRYVGGTNAAITSTSSGNLNVRSGAGTSYAVTGTVPNGRTVLVLSESSGWSRILFNGTMTGYVSTQFLKSIMAWPVPNSHKINQYYGTHKGIDIGASVRGVTGDNIVAAQSGKVVYAGWLSGYGYVVYINAVYNGQLIQTRYGHLVSAPRVTAGQTVAAGQTIGYMGNTGTSSGVHLHFEVRIRNSSADCIANADSTAVDPFGYVK